MNLRPCLLALLVVPLAHADVKLPAIFSAHAVLQREASVPVWGWAAPGEKVRVQFAGNAQETTADAAGKWRVNFSGLKAGGPHTLVVKGANEITVPDVLIGEVWLGSGQSNMAMTVERSKEFEQEKAKAALPQVRMFTVGSGAAATAQENCAGSWVVCSPESVGRFSATLFFFGREIHRAVGVPVGLINSSVGGTPIESWIAPEAQHAAPELKGFFDSIKKDNAAFDAVKAKASYDTALAKWKLAAAKAKAEGKPAPRAPRDPVALHERKGNVGGLFNGKIAPLIPYAIRGALWYQGEANSMPEKAKHYHAQLALLVTDWRARWGNEFPMAWAQLPNFDGAGRNWPAVREAMLKTLALPKTGMGINIDIGDAKDIHPKNKQEVGRRLAMWALGSVYGQTGATSGPLPAGHKVRGAEIVLNFTHADGGLVAKGGELKGFVVAGADKQWKPAHARIDGDKVIVSSAEVTKPVAVRYAWENNPACNLYNRAGLPASPFRTDTWQ
ncbi:MAG: sialate O-acetylesterase [Chthoniobacteraceae bacterium]